MLSKVMKRAHQIAKNFVGHYFARLKMALIVAWKEAKSVVANESGSVGKKKYIVDHTGALEMDYNTYSSLSSSERENVKKNFVFSPGGESKWFIKRDRFNVLKDEIEIDVSEHHLVKRWKERLKKGKTTLEKVIERIEKQESKDNWTRFIDGWNEKMRKAMKKEMKEMK